MDFHLFKKPPLQQNDPETWRRLWQSLVSPECRNVPITVDGQTIEAFICVNHIALMLQDGLLMEASFFDVCEHFQKAGYHVVWLMRCIQDVYNGYLKPGKILDGGSRRQWIWKSPTTNFGRWTSDNHAATILIQYRQLPKEDPTTCDERILQRVTWAESDDSTQMIPGHTVFSTVDSPASPRELLQWLNGASLSQLRNSAENA